jgi:hypothetical protein
VPREDFSDVLETASKAAGINLEFGSGQQARPSWSLRSASSHLQQLAERERASRASMLSASIESYLEQLGDGRAQRLVRTANPGAIADELGITAQMTCDDLNRLRRKFALANHPDRSNSEEREIATRRMMIANMLIDRELKRRG